MKLILTSFLTASTTLVTILGFFLQYHNLLAEFWIRLDDAEKVAISRHTVFTRGVAQLTSHIIDTFFGRKYFSLHAIAASMYLSSASFGFLFLLAAVLPHPMHAVKSMGLISRLVIIIVILLWVAACLWLARDLARERNRLERWLSFVPLIGMTGFLWLFVGTIWGADVRPNARSSDVYFYFIAGAIIASFACDVLFIAATRWALRWCSEMSTGKILAVVLVNIASGTTLVVAPLWFRLSTTEMGTWRSWFWPLGMLNGLDALVSAAFVVVATTLLAYRFCWPVMKKPLYVLEEFFRSAGNRWGR